MIRQKSNGFFIPDEQISVDMDIVISSLKVPYLRVSYYGNEQLAIPDGQTLSFLLDNEEIIRMEDEAQKSDLDATHAEMFFDILVDREIP